MMRIPCLTGSLISRYGLMKAAQKPGVYTSDYGNTDPGSIKGSIAAFSGCKALPILSSSTLSSSDDCYSLGYSSSVTEYSDPSEVITHHGTFKRIETLDGVEFVVSSMD